MTRFSLMHLAIDFAHLMHEIDSFKLHEETIDARANRMLFLEHIVDGMVCIK